MAVQGPVSRKTMRETKKLFWARWYYLKATQAHDIDLGIDVLPFELEF
jgi:hypothetical protein